MKYSYVSNNPSKSCSAKGAYLKVHFKNTVETSNVIRGMMLEKAVKYLKDVICHKQCVPFKKFNGHVGRTGQAKVFGVTQGRWPQKSCRFILELLKNAKSNAEAKGLKMDKLFLKHIVVNRAPKQRRRTYRAHGRINPFMSNPCHIDMVLEEKPDSVRDTEKALVKK